MTESLGRTEEKSHVGSSPEDVNRERFNVHRINQSKEDQGCGRLGRRKNDVSVKRFSFSIVTRQITGTLHGCFISFFF